MATNVDTEPRRPKPVFWIASSRKDLKKFPKGVRQTVGQALFDAQTGGKHPDAKPLRGFGGAGVLEVVENDDGNAYRAVYTVKFAGAPPDKFAYEDTKCYGLSAAEVGRNMPPYPHSTSLTQREIAAVADYILATFAGK